MGRVSLENIKPGMVLAQDAIANGNVLLPKGVTLTEKHLKVFKTWGFADLEIEGVSNAALNEQALGKVDENQKKQIENELKSRFVRCDLAHPFYKELFHLCALRRIRQEKK